MSAGDDVVWLEPEQTVEADDEVVATGRPPLRRRTRLALVVAALAVIGGLITYGASTGHDTQVAMTTAPPTPTPTLHTADPTYRPRSLNPPNPVVAAVRTVFPDAEVSSFVTVNRPGSVGPSRIFNLQSGKRTITVSVSPPAPRDVDAVNRTSDSVEIAQRLGGYQIDIRIEVAGGAPTARDFEAIQALVQDGRLLVSR